MKVARIAVNYPLKNNGLLYLYEEDLQRGQVVEVPLGKRSEMGCVISLNESESQEFKDTPFEKIKFVKAKVEGWKLEEKSLNSMSGRPSTITIV